MNGNISKEGITADLAWMKRVGLGGVQAFDASLGMPAVVDRPLKYMSPEWKDAFRLAVQQAAENGLEFGIASSPGFSETGGPWVTPQDGMKKLTWSEVTLTGKKAEAVTLPLPPDAIGPFKDLGSTVLGKTPEPIAPFYRDVAVLAYPIGAAETESQPEVTDLSGEKIDGNVLSDGAYKQGTRISTGTAEKPGGLMVSFAAPRTIRSANLFISGKTALMDVALAPRLEANISGIWTKVAELPVGIVPTTASFPAVTARQFRLILAPHKVAGLNQNNPAPGAVGAEVLGGMGGATPKSANITEFRLSSEAKVNRFETKAGFAVSDDYYALDPAGIGEADGVPLGKVLNLTKHMDASGKLDWRPSGGRWRIVRLGYALTGATNHPAASEATGLEVDKMDGAAVGRYMDHYLGMYRDASGKSLGAPDGIRALLNDSIEAGDANWTPDMIGQFKSKRGYDPVPWLPALTGEIVVSREKSDAFLYDYRRTIAELITGEHYGTIAAIARRNGLRSYMESLEGARAQLGDDIDMRAQADVPMAAMWAFTPERGPKLGYVIDIKSAASAAHFYGRSAVAAESFTSLLRPWADAPRDLKATIDLELVTGVNLPIIHTSVHQPMDAKPGLPFHIIGQYFNRLDSWAEMAKPWIDYMARSSFMLQQGHSQADVAYFYGEEAPVAGLYSEKLPADAPAHYGYDFVNANMLRQLKVEGGDLVAPGGVRYRALYLGGSSKRMTLATLKTLATLVAAGARVVGDAPISSPALADDRAAFKELVAGLWGDGAQQNRRVLAGPNIETVLAAAGVAPDVRITGVSKGGQVLFLHRQLPDGEVYFLNNRLARQENVEAHFRVIGKAPELWRAEDASIAPLPYRIVGNETIVPLGLLEQDAVFVVFRKNTSETSRSISPRADRLTQELQGPWSISFQSNRGAPAKTTLPTLTSLTEVPDPGIKYFSGISTYSRSFKLPKGVKAGQSLLLDLGTVGDLAEVWINGKLLGSVWHSPYSLDIGSATKSGTNQLEVRIANLWVNRLIGDAQPNAVKVTNPVRPTYKADAPLRPSGLIGPVRLVYQEEMAGP